MKHPFLKPVRATRASALDRAVSKLSLFDQVVRVTQNADNTLVIYVRGSVDDSYDSIVQFLRTHVPGVHGQIRRAAEPPVPAPKLGRKGAEGFTH